MYKMLMKDATSGAIFPQYEAPVLMLRHYSRTFKPSDKNA
jgi:hypothetical protein